MAGGKKLAYEDDDEFDLAIEVEDDDESFDGNIDDDEADKLLRANSDDEMPEVNLASNLFHNRKALAAALHPTVVQTVEAEILDQAAQGKFF